jgi:hypothetical protein
MESHRRTNILRATAAQLAGGALPSLLAALLGAYLVRRSTAHRRPRPVPAEVLAAGERVQLPGDGVGTLFHRRYAVVIDEPRLERRRLMARIKGNLQAFSPKTLADFQKTKGHPRKLRVGDEYQITILGPWNGGVRVSEATPTSFTFVTLEGHPEAGQITFALTPHALRPGSVCFEINSWARSRDAAVDLGYKQIPIGKEVQKNAWVTFCERVVEASGGAQFGEIEVETHELDNAKKKVVPVV